MRAVWSTKERATIIQTPAPTVQDLAPDELLIQNRSVAINPKDWKLPYYAGREAVEGSDIAGIVTEVGSNVTRFKKGDRVAAMIKMRSKWGAFAEFSVAPQNSTFLIPDNLGFNDASTFPMAYLTASIAIFNTLRVPSDAFENYATVGSAPNLDKGILIFGAATTVGIYAAQISKMAGLVPFGICSESSIPHAVQFGYHDASFLIGQKPYDFDADELAGKIQSVWKNKPICYVIDLVSSTSSILAICKFLASNNKQNVTIATVLPIQLPEGFVVPQDIKISRVFVADAHVSLDKPDSPIPILVESQMIYLPKLIEAGMVRPQKIELCPGGLEGVPAALKRSQNWGFSGCKAVLEI